jgi:hypothetical protein
LTAAVHPGTGSIRLLGLTLEKGQAIAVWLMFATSFVVSIEPAPCDLMFLVALALCLWRGLQASVLVWPLIFYLLLYNMGGFLSFLEATTVPKAGMFVITSTYMAASAAFLAFLITRDPIRNMNVIKSGWVLAAFIASVFAMAGYFNVAGLGGALAPLGRAQGFFKDPNVLSTFLIPPALLLIQDIFQKRPGNRVLAAFALLTIIAAWFLAFSRGAWISLVAAAALMMVLTFVLSPSWGLRNRIVLLSIAGVGIAAVLLSVLLSIPFVQALFVERFALVQYYDAGETGRFGNQLNSIGLLMQRPLGLGPFMFRAEFGADPHNVYINAFASYGWVGGFSYIMLIVSTLVAGFRSILVRTPWQPYMIAVFCGLFTTILQGVQIDTDHWRHFYWSLGITWGFFAASMMYSPGRAPVRPGTVATVQPRSAA